MPSPTAYGEMVARVTRDWDVHLTFEPGRVIAGNAGVLLTRVVRVKRGGNGPPFVIVDAAMNDLARPALYGAWHDFDAVGVLSWFLSDDGIDAEREVVLL